MPTYEYACRDCGERLEVVQSFTDDPLTVCPACEGRLRKIFSAAGIVFKGSGWHIKDYGTSTSSRTKPGSEPGPESGPDSDPGSGTGSDAGTSDGAGDRGSSASAEGDRKSA